MDTIRYGDPKHHVTGYLSNSYTSRGFSLEGRRWPSVEHYVQAKKFEGTQFEEEIRKATTAFRLKKLTTPRIRYIYTEESGIPKYDMVYGGSLYLSTAPSYHVRPDWEKVKRMFMKKAMYTKFVENPDLLDALLLTGGDVLEDKFDNDAGKILMEVRDELRPKKASPKNILEVRMCDYAYENPTKKDKIFIRRFIKLCKRVCTAERLPRNKIYYGMIEDAIFSISDEKLLQEYIEHYQKKRKWSEIYESMPQFVKLVRYIENNNSYLFDEKKRKKCVLTVAILVKYITDIRSSDLRLRVKRFKEIEIKLQPKIRSYRL